MSMLSIKIGATLDGSFNSAMTGSTAKLSKLGDSIKQLDSSMKSVSKFKQLNHDALEAMKNWKEAEKKAKESAAVIAKEKKEKKEPSKALRNEFEKLKASASKAKEAYIKKRDTLHTLNEEIRKSGKDIKSLVRDQTKLGSSIEVLKGKYNKLGSVIQKQQNALAKKAHYRSQIIETIGLGLTLAAPIKVAVDFESAMADVKKVVKFVQNDTKDEALKFAKELKKLSREIPLSAAELAQIAASGGQLGIDKNDLIKFTTVVAKMTTAFDMSAEEAGNAIAKISNVYGIKVDGMENVGNIINHLSDNTAAKAQEVVLTLNRIGGNAKQFGLEVDQASSLASTFISLGKQPEKAATAINNFLSKLQTAREQSPEFHDALDEMGTSIEELEQTIKKNPQEAILQFLETLKRIDDQERAGILMNLFGAGFQDDIALLVGSLDIYKKAIEQVADKGKYRSSMQKEFENRANTTANKLQLLKNAVFEAGMNLGSVMLPTLNYVAGSLKAITERIASFAEKYPTLTTVIMSTLAALISLKVLVVGVGYGITLLGSTIFGLKATILATFSFLSAIVFPAVITGLRAITLAVMTNPIGLLIASLVSGAAYVLTNWQKVKDFFSSFWKSLIEPIGKAFSWMGNTVSSIFAENNPIRKFENNGNFVNKLSKNSIFSNGNPLTSNSAIKQFSENSKGNFESFKVKGVIEEKRAIEQEEIEKAFKKSRYENRESKVYNQAFYQTFNINIKSEDVRSVADAVIERFREQARGALFDIVEELH
ncbi:phage tail tape measure protein [Wolbachia endosymbiont (group B) of Apotomis betuletana]|uniref:phage tail tape measure protein n=1 Tax=Wolbachia endosymbiont (group B) of Apotomis betuletana TaxID=2953982 RepID=UPI0022270DBE|nr:phage tail tape measure protein [Wolbachia endosymbiont (group B) of Apotomis betuletana]